MTESIPYIFQSIVAAPKSEKVNTLRYYGSKHIVEILKHAFHPNIEFALPPGAPPYVHKGDQDSYPKTLYPRVREFYLYTKNGKPDLNQIRREALFVQLLEDLHPDEAKIVVAMKDKVLDELYQGLTYEVVKEAFPNILPDKPKPQKQKTKKTLKKT